MSIMVNVNIAHGQLKTKLMTTSMAEQLTEELGVVHTSGLPH
jgi:hypothetical protein